MEKVMKVHLQSTTARPTQSNAQHRESNIAFLALKNIKSQLKTQAFKQTGLTLRSYNRSTLIWNDFDRFPTAYAIIIVQ